MIRDFDTERVSRGRFVFLGPTLIYDEGLAEADCLPALVRTNEFLMDKETRYTALNGPVNTNTLRVTARTVRTSPNPAAEARILAMSILLQRNQKHVFL